MNTIQAENRDDLESGKLLVSSEDFIKNDIDEYIPTEDDEHESNMRSVIDA